MFKEKKHSSILLSSHKVRSKEQMLLCTASTDNVELNVTPTFRRGGHNVYKQILTFIYLA